ncbi:hypothetical protein JTB14_014586 [Gonioctena quinquepunctata]|nr:hypothetical protein JTB14_014586 [Gonioctena quinquepunctata]
MNPELYSKNNCLQAEENTNVINKYLDFDEWHNGESVLEIGMGDGGYTVEMFLPRLPKNIRRYIGSDISPNMVEYAKKKYPKEKYPIIDFTVLDPQNGIPAGFIDEFDHVVSFNCFHFFSNARKALQNIYSVLKPGGGIIASFLERNTEDDIFYNLSQHPRWGAYGHGQYVSSFIFSSDPQEEWKNTFIRAGFVNVRIVCEERTVIFPDEKCLEDFFLALDPVLVKISNIDRAEYLSDYLQEVKKGKTITILFDNSGEQKFIMTYKIMIFIASKPIFQ